MSRRRRIRPPLDAESWYVLGLFFLILLLAVLLLAFQAVSAR